MQIYKKCSVNTLAVGWMAHGNSMPWMVPRPRAGAARPSPTPEAAPRRPLRGARARGLSGGAQDNGKMRSLLYCRPWPSRRPVRSARSHAARSLTLERPGSDPVGEGGAVEAD